MPPKLRDPNLTAIERTAVIAVLQAEQQLVERLGQVQADKAEIAKDIERHHRLPAGALGEEPTYQVNAETWMLEPIVQNGKPA